MPRFFSMPHRCIINVMKNEGDLFPPKKLAGTVVFEVLGDNLLLCCLFSLALFLKDTGSLTWIDSPVSRSRAEAEDCCFQNVKGSRQDDRVSFYSLRTLQGCCWSGFISLLVLLLGNVTFQLTNRLPGKVMEVNAFVHHHILALWIGIKSWDTDELIWFRWSKVKVTLTTSPPRYRDLSGTPWEHSCTFRSL